MSRSARDNRPYVKPVKKIELSDKNVKRRILFVAFFLVLGVIFLANGVSKLLYTPSGWSQIDVDKNSDKSCADDFVFYYNLGQTETSASDERRNIKKLYFDACNSAYKLFTSTDEIEDCNNVYYINRHPNQEIEVDEPLYNAFKTLVESKNRNIFLGPVLEHYINLFFCEDQVQTIEYDPYRNDEIAKYYQEIADYARSDKDISLELLGNNTIRLNVSDGYLEYANENAIESYIDFGWMKNAFIADFIADTFVKNGYTYGMLSSHDGFARSFVGDDAECQVDYDCLYNDAIYPAATYNYKGNMSTVTMRNYGVVSKDERSYYAMSDGTRRNMYIDIADGKCKSAADQLTLMSKDMSCAELALEMIPVYIGDSFKEQDSKTLQEKGVFSIYCKGKVIYYNNSEINIDKLYDKDGIKFTTSFIK